MAVFYIILYNLIYWYSKCNIDLWKYKNNHIPSIQKTTHLKWRVLDQFGMIWTIMAFLNPFQLCVKFDGCITCILILNSYTYFLWPHLSHWILQCFWARYNLFCVGGKRWSIKLNEWQRALSGKYQNLISWEHKSLFRAVNISQ